MTQFFLKPLIIVLIPLGISLAVTGIECFMGLLSPFFSFYKKFRFSFGSCGCVIGMYYSLYSLLIYQTPLPPIVYWGIFIMVLILPPIFQGLFEFIKQKKRKKLIHDAIKKASLFCSEMTADGYVKGIAADVFADDLDELIQYILYGDGPPAEHERNIMTLLKVYTKIMRFRYYGFKYASASRASKNPKPGKEII